MPDVLPEGGAPPVARAAAAGAREVERDGAGAAAQSLLGTAARDERLPLGAPGPAGGVLAGELHCHGDRRVRGARRQRRVREAGPGWPGGGVMEREGGVRGERG